MSFHPAATLLDAGVTTAKEAFTALVVTRLSGTVMEQLFEVFADDEEEHFPWQDRKRLTKEQLEEREKLAKHNWKMMLRFLNLFAGVRFDVPGQDVLTNLAVEAGVYTEVAERGRSAAEVAAERGMNEDQVDRIVARVGAIMEAMKGRPGKRKAKS